MKVEMITSSVGGVLMLTSLGWGGITYLSLPMLTNDRVASTDTVIKTLALGDKPQLTIADKNAITDFAKTAKETLKLNPNTKLWVVTTPGTEDEISKRKSAVFDALTKAGFPENRIDRKVMDNAVQFHDVVKAIDPAKHQNNLDTAIIFGPEFLN